MSHQHHSILRPNPQHVRGVGGNHCNPLGFRKPLRASQLCPPIHNSHAPPKQCAHANQRLCIVSSTQNKQPLRRRNPFHKRLLGHPVDPTLSQDSNPCLHQLRFGQPLTREGEVATSCKHRAGQPPALIRQPGQHRRLFSTKRPFHSRHQRLTLGSVPWLKQ